jgi:hypothetical protein
MNKRIIKAVALVFLGVLLATLPGLASCAEEEEKVGVFTVGWLQDLTGRASFGVVQVYDGLNDYLRKMEEEEPIPGVKISVITYDTRGDYARVPAGYVWMKTQGATLLSVACHEALVVEDRFVTDECPVFYMTSDLQLDKSEWYFSAFAHPPAEVEVLMEWLKTSWDYDLGEPKIGVLSYAGIVFYEDQADKVKEITELYPDSYEWVGAQKAPVGTMTFAAEVSRLMECNFIYTAISGPPLAAFIQEARARGWEGTFIGAGETMPSFWGLVKGAVPLAQLDGCVAACYFPHPDDPGVPAILEAKEYMEGHHTSKEVETYLTATGYCTGWAMGILLVDIVKRAADSVGAENVGEIGGRVLRDVIRETNLTIEGLGETFKSRGDWSILNRSIHLLRFSAAQDRWIPLTDWLVPPSLAVAGED